MSWIADLSFAHDTVSYTDLARRGATAVIGYVSTSPGKNLTSANLQAIQAAGLAVGLVYEDTVNDMQTGANYGRGAGLTAVQQAVGIGYDASDCVIFAANDRNSGMLDLPAILAYMEAFAAYVPHPGYYGDQDSIDYLAARRPGWWYWQSSSSSYGAGVSAHAHLLQRFNDPRATGLPVDANDVLRQGIPLMGDDMFTDTDRAMLTKVATQMGVVSYTEGLTLPAIAEIRGNAQSIAKAVTNLHLAPDPAAFAAELAPLIHSTDPAELQNALSAVLSEVKVTVSGS